MTKKIFLSGILFLMFLSISGFGQMYGDVNGSSTIDVIDALLTSQYYVGLPISNFDTIAADVDASGGVTVIDALLIAQFYVGLIDRFPADDVQPTPTPVTGTEKIINGDFSNGTMNWSAGIYAPGTGSATVSNGELHIGITNGGTATWNIQISQGNLNMISGTDYTFSFAARSASARTIEANVGMSVDPYTSYSASGPLNITPTMTTYTFTFTAPADDATARVEFNCGLAAIDVYIDNVSLLAGAAPTPGPTPVPVAINFPDANLEAAIRAVINKPTGQIYNTDVYTLTGLSLSLKNIANATGLEYFNALQTLVLNYNYNLTDITPLANLTNLRDLNIGANRISNLTPIANLTNLTRLNIVINGISDLSPIANLAKCGTSLQANGNEIVSIAPLANLTKVTNLILYLNDIVDIAPLANLVDVTYLDLSDNNIVNITPLANLTKLAVLNLCDNPISNITALGTLTNLTNLKINTGILADITALANCNKLEYLNLDNNSISDITPLRYITSLKDVSLLGNPLTASAQAVVEALRANGTYVVY